MPTLTCEDFGLTQEQMLERLIDTMADRLFGEAIDRDLDDEEYQVSNRQQVITALNTRIKEEIDKQVNAIFDQHILGKIDELLTKLVIPQTNKYGEPKREPLTLIEYITEKSEAWLEEPVNWKGKSKKEEAYSWSKDTTRLMYAVNKNLEDVLNRVVNDGAKEVQGAFAEQVKNAVADAVTRLTLSVKTDVKQTRR